MNFRNIFRGISVFSLMVMQASADGNISAVRLVEEPAPAETRTVQGKGKGGKKKQDATMSVVLTIDTVQGNEYQVQATGNLVSGNWEDLGDVFTATQNSTTLSFPESDLHRFFRVIVLTQNVAPVLSASPPPPGPPPSGPPSVPPI